MSEQERDKVLQTRLEAAVEYYNAMPLVERALHDDDQRRSFVRGQSGRDLGPSVLADEVRRPSAQNDDLQAALDHAHAELVRYRNTPILGLVREAEAERDAALQEAASLRQALAAATGALDDALVWHEDQRKAMSKQPPSGRNEWLWLEHREQIDALATAVALALAAGPAQPLGGGKR